MEQQFHLADEEAARRFGARFGLSLRPGMTVLLEGPVGAGKSHLARAAIRALAGAEIDVPSPTFTLVQTYDTGAGEIWHADLYRLTDIAEVEELGLTAAMGEAILLIEWPDRLGSYAPADAIRVALAYEGEGRRLTVTAPAEFLASLTDGGAREAEKAAFLARAGWGAALRAHLAGDASARSYERLSLGAAHTVLMDAPPGCGDDVGAFHRIGAHLAGLGLSPPQTLAMDEARGLMLIEDLGDGVYARLLEADPALEPAFYTAAVDVLIRLQPAPAPAGLPDLSAADWAHSAALAPEFYALAATGTRPDATRLIAALEQALRLHADGPRVLILRDYHAENLLWLPDREGVAQVGLLDFQLGQLGQPEYDLVSLLQDARRDVSPLTEARMIAHFAQQTGRGDISAAYATLGALRALRIIGIFARLCMVAGKDRYLAYLPRVWGQLMRNLAHPALTDLRAAALAILPAPDSTIIERIRACRQISP